MKGAINVRVILGLGLLALGGARALAAAEVVGDGQQQARLLLSGRGGSSPNSGFVSRSSVAAKSIAPDAQKQAREMILGRQSAKTGIIEAVGSHLAAAGRDQRIAADPHEMARLLILGRQSAGREPKIRLTGKPE